MLRQTQVLCLLFVVSLSAPCTHGFSTPAPLLRQWQRAPARLGAMRMMSGFPFGPTGANSHKVLLRIVIYDCVLWFPLFLTPCARGTCAGQIFVPAAAAACLRGWPRSSIVCRASSVVHMKAITKKPWPRYWQHMCSTCDDSDSDMVMAWCASSIAGFARLCFHLVWHVSAILLQFCDAAMLSRALRVVLLSVFLRLCM